MNNFKNTPASMRYLGARLKPFRRPMFWGSLGLASLIGLALYQYWRNPDLLDGNLSAIQNNSNSSTSKFSNLTNQGQISSEDLAIGAELDNLDLLLTELEQNQTIPIGKIDKSKKSRNSFPSYNQDTIYRNFQAKQKSQLKRSPKPLISTKSTANNLVQSPTRNLFKLSNFNTPKPINTQNSASSNSELIPNPVGRLYLSERNQINNNFRANTPSSSPNYFANPNSVSSSSQTTNGNLDTRNFSGSATSEIRVNRGGNINATTPSPIPYNNNINATPITPRPAYGQPIYQQPTNFVTNPGTISNQNGNLLPNVAPTRFQSSTLTNQEQTQRYYQLTPSNYQLQQPIQYNRRNLNTGFNSQPNNFSSSGSFAESQFNNN